MHGIEIIDSPGVCALGGMDKTTLQYIKSADAIIFLKPVSGQALESNQFDRFMRNASVERNKNALFLVLTRAADVTSAELLRLEAEAHRQFNKLDKNKILLVDSKAELYAKKLSTVEDVEAELRRLNEEGILDDFVVKAYADISGLFGSGDKGDFIKALKEKSRFAHIYDALEKFGRKAHYILLGSLLTSIESLYSKLWNDLNEQMDMFRQKAEDPTELAKKIAKIKQELDEINNKMYKGVDEVVRRFRGDDGIIKTTANNAAADYEKQIATINASSQDAFNELERYSIRKIDEFKKLTEDIQQQVVAECDKELVALSNKSTIPFESLKPDFTETTFSEIRESTKSKATETRSFEEGVTFKKTHTYSEYSQIKHYGIIKSDIIPRLDKIKNDLIENLGDFVEKIQTRYHDELSKNADAKKNDLDAIYELKATNDQIMKYIDEIAKLTAQLENARADVAKMKGGIDKNV
jgi:hypothetical protein